MKNAPKRILCAFLAMLTLSSIFTRLPVHAENNIAPTAYNVDFSDPQSDFNVTASPSQILGMLYPDSVTKAEGEYLDAYFETALVYCPEISASNVSVKADGQSVTVTART